MQRQRFFPPHERAASWYIVLVAMTAMLASILVPPAAQAQTFNSGSTEADGALDLTTPGTIIFNPRTFNPPPLIQIGIMSFTSPSSTLPLA